MKKAFFISVIALSPLLLAIVPTAESKQTTEVAEQSEQTGQAESKGDEHTENHEAAAGTECKEGAELGPDGKPKTEEAHDHPSCGCGY